MVHHPTWTVKLVVGNSVDGWRDPRWWVRGPELWYLYGDLDCRSVVGLAMCHARAYELSASTPDGGVVPAFTPGMPTPKFVLNKNSDSRVLRPTLRKKIGKWQMLESNLLQNAWHSHKTFISPDLETCYPCTLPQHVHQEQRGHQTLSF